MRKLRIPAIILVNILLHFGTRFWGENWWEMGGYTKLQAFLLLLAIPVGDALWDCRCSFFFFFFLFFPPLLSGPYLWNRYSQRLQIECAAWSCCLILHYSLPSNSLRYYYYFFFPPRFCRRHISGTVTRRDSKLSVLLGPVV